MHFQSLYLSAVAVSAVSFGWGALDKPSASNLIWSDEPAVVVYPQEDKNSEGSFGKYRKPASVWEAEGYPIGNGRVGAMIFSAPGRERRALNEISLWSGGANPGGGYGYGPDAGTNQFGNYLPFGDLFVDFKKGDQPASLSVEDFTRALDLRDGIHKVNYKADGVTYDREAFSSTPANVLVLNYKASKPGQFSADFSVNSQLGADISAKGPVITWKGILKNGMNYEGRVLIRPKGGTLSAAGDKISVKNADSCMVVIAMETDYLMDYKKDWKGESPARKLDRYVAKAASADYAALKQAHISQYKSMFDRVKVNFGKTEEDVAKLPTPKRLEAYKKNPADPNLEETMFQFGRSRPICRGCGMIMSNRRGPATTITTSTSRWRIGGRNPPTSPNAMRPWSITWKQWPPAAGTLPRRTRGSIPRTANPCAAGRCAPPRISSVATAGSGTSPVRPGMRCIYGNIIHLPVIESIWKNRRIP